jgi:hypothetical protein
VTKPIGGVGAEIILADRSRRDIERLLAMASAPDPAAALETERTKARTRMARMRTARAEGDTANIPDVSRTSSPLRIELGPISNAKIAEIIELFVSLHPDEQDEAINRMLEIMANQGVQYF